MAKKSEESIGFEEARDELMSIVSALEGGGHTLEQSLALWQRGEELAGLCQTWLDTARATLDAAVSEADTSIQRG